MQIIIKGRNVEVPEDLHAYIEDKVGSVFENNLKEPTVCDVVLADENGPKGGLDRLVHITCNIPNIKNPVYVAESSEDYYKTIDLAADKLKRAFHNARR